MKIQIQIGKFILGKINKSGSLGKRLLFAVSVSLLFSLAYADIGCAVKGGGILDNLVSQFGDTADGWQNQIDPLAKKFFFILFGMEFMWQLAVNKVFAGDIEKLWVFFFTRSASCFFFAKYIVNVDFYRQIIEFFARIGSQATGYSLSIAHGGNFSSMGPSEIIGNFACIADSIHIVTDGTGSFQYITLKISLAIMQVMLLGVLAIIAYYLMKVILQTYFMLYVGFLLTGFAGSSWTMSFWQRYVQAIAGIAIKFMAICFLFGVLMTQIKGWAMEISTATTIQQLTAEIIKVLVSSIIIALLIQELPEWVASTLAGNINMRFGSRLSNISDMLSGGGGVSSKLSPPIFRK